MRNYENRLSAQAAMVLVAVSGFVWQLRSFPE